MKALYNDLEKSFNRIDCLNPTDSILFKIILFLILMSSFTKTQMRIVQDYYDFNKNKPENCLRVFKFNNISGLLLFLSILTINF